MFLSVRRSAVTLVGLLVSCLTLLVVNRAQAGVNELFPGDYTALPAGVSSATWYMFQRHEEGPYRDGRRLADWELDSNVQALRLTRAFDVGDQRFSGLVVLSGAYLNLDADNLRQHRA